MKKIFSILCAMAAFVLADDVLRFVPDPYELGEIPQGESRHIKFSGANVSGKTVNIETVLCQGIGCKNFRFPKSVKPREPVNIELDFSTKNLEGRFANTVVVVDAEGNPHPTAFQGTAVAPFLFSEKMFDAGYYSAGEKREWTFYVWCTDLKTLPDLSLSSEASEFSAKIQKVSLDVSNFDSIQEKGNVPGLKITLSTRGLVRDPKSKQKSLSKIVSFSSRKFPAATPEVLIIGYWK